MELENINNNLSSCANIEYKECSINGIPFVLLDLSSSPKVQTMGIDEGENITKAFEFATYKKLPIVVMTSSGGVNVQGGTMALMQMIKTVTAVNLHSQNNLLYIAVIKNTTLGGVSASFVALADIIIALPNTIYGFTGRRIIMNTINEVLNENFQTSEFAFEHGMIDMIIEEKKIWDTVLQILRIHRGD